MASSIWAVLTEETCEIWFILKRDFSFIKLSTNLFF